MLDIRLIGSHLEYSPRRTRLIALLCLLFPFSILFAQTDYVEISVVEENWCATNPPNYVGNCINEKDLFMSRMIFYSEGRTWHSANDKITYSKTDSSICDNCPVFNSQFIYQGEIFLGKVKINNSFIGHCYPSETEYHRDYTLSTAFEIINQKDVPKVKNYEGSYSSSNTVATYRPLIALSHKKNYPILYTIQNGVTQESVGIYRFIEDTLMNDSCISRHYNLYNLYSENYCLSVIGEDDSIIFSIASIDIPRFQEYYKECDNENGDKVAKNKSRYNFEKVRDDLSRSHHKAVFLLDGPKATYLDSGLELVDYGDYNGDGKLEWIFKYTETFYDSYVMFYNDFTSRVECGWSWNNNFKQ